MVNGFMDGIGLAVLCRLMVVGYICLKMVTVFV